MEWAPPSAKVAEIERDKNRVHDEQGNLYPLVGKPRGKSDHWTFHFGTGITLYFRFLKFLSWLFLGLTIITLPHVVLAVLADNMELGPDSTGLERTTLGNLFVNETGLVGDELFEEVTFEVPYGPHWTLKKAWIAWGLPGLDLLGAFIFWVGCKFFAHVIARAAQKADDAQLTAWDYSVSVKNIPPDAKADELQRFLEKFGPVKHLTLVCYTDKFLSFTIKRHNLEKQLEVALARASKVIFSFQNKGQEPPIYWQDDDLKTRDARYTKIVHDVAVIHAKITELTVERQVEKQKGEAHCAFAMFEYERGAKRAVANNRGGACNRKFKFRDRHAVRIRDAPEPLNLVWPNLQYSRVNRRVRRVITTVVMFVLLCVSLAALVGAKTWSQEVEESTNCKIVEALPWCPDFKAELLVNRSDLTAAEFAALQMARINTATGITEKQRDDCQGCMCLAAVRKSEFQKLLGKDNTFRKFCLSVTTELLKKAGLIGLSIVAVVSVNFLLKLFIRGLVVWEKHHTKSGLESGIAIKVFLGMFINTALITLLVNAQVPEVSEWFDKRGRSFILFDGSHSDMDNAWYSDVAAALLLTMAVNMAVSVSPMAFFVVQKFKQWRIRRTAVCQNQINEVYRGPKFNLAERFGQLLSTLFVCMMFSATAPLFNAIAFLTFVLTYWCDKITVLRLYQPPPPLSDDLGRLALNVMPWSLVPHLGIGLWGFSALMPRQPLNHYVQAYVNEAYARSGASSLSTKYDIQVRIANWATLPLFAGFCCVVLWLLSSKILKPLLACVCSVCKKGKMDHLDQTMTLSQAWRSADWRGPPNYDIRHNPKYRSAVDDQFRIEGRRVSVVETPATEGVGPTLWQDVEAGGVGMSVEAGTAPRAVTHTDNARLQQPALLAAPLAAPHLASAPQPAPTAAGIAPGVAFGAGALSIPPALSPMPSAPAMVADPAAVIPQFNDQAVAAPRTVPSWAAQAVAGAAQQTMQTGFYPPQAPAPRSLNMPPVAPMAGADMAGPAAPAYPAPQQWPTQQPPAPEVAAPVPTVLQALAPVAAAPSGASDQLARLQAMQAQMAALANAPPEAQLAQLQAMQAQLAAIQQATDSAPVAIQGPSAMAAMPGGRPYVMYAGASAPAQGFVSPAPPQQMAMMAAVPAMPMMTLAQPQLQPQQGFVPMASVPMAPAPTNGGGRLNRPTPQGAFF